MSINNLKNYLLISTPGLNDSIFRKSIILICDHDENGAMGLILNKPIRFRKRWIKNKLWIEENINP